jgi:hypothetical protein
MAERSGGRGSRRQTAKGGPGAIKVPTLLEVAILHRVSALLGLGPVDPSLVHERAFEGGAFRLAGRVLDSLDVVELVVRLEIELGIHLLDREDLAHAGTLAGLAALVETKADPLTVQHFCDAWAPWPGP